MYLLARSDGSVLSRQMCETKDILHVSEEKLRERDAEVARGRVVGCGSCKGGGGGGGSHHFQKRGS